MIPPSAALPTLHEIGRHTLRIDGNCIEAIFVGTMAEDEARRIFALYDALIAEYGHVCTITDLAKARGIEPAVRRLSVEWGKRNHASIFSALHGGSRPMRVVITLILSALRALTSKTIPVAFFETADEAQRWLAPHRRSCPAPSSSPPS